jgi:hypothetical protein
MKATRPADVRAWLQTRWDRGEWLAALVTGEPVFPVCPPFKTPASTEITDHFEDVRRWIAEWREQASCRVAMRQFRHRVFGDNTMPEAVWFDDIEQVAVWIGTRRELVRFRALLAIVSHRQPALTAWMARRPLRALELAGEWERLLDVVDWVLRHPRSGLYLRQVDIPGVHSKFIEAHRGVLAEWLELTLPPSAINSAFTGVGGFAARYGFREKPLRVRFRLLDRALAQGLPGNDITLDADSFARLTLPVRQVFMTENELNFLTFPPVSGGVMIWGAGYGFEALAGADWLERCRLHYWGDIDTHGFAILDQLRDRFTQVGSLLMNRATLMAFQEHWGEEDKPTQRELSRLTPEEQALYDDLRDNRLQRHLRLEQERVGFEHVQTVLNELRLLDDLSR